MESEDMACDVLQGGKGYREPQCVPVTPEQEALWREQATAKEREYRALQRRHTALAMALSSTGHGCSPEHVVATAEAFDAFLVGRPNAPTN